VWSSFAGSAAELIDDMTRVQPLDDERSLRRLCGGQGDYLRMVFVVG
jgi:hypothetical protein